MDVPRFLSSFTNGHSGCSHILTAANNAAITAELQSLLEVLISLLLDPVQISDPQNCEP